MRLLLNCGESGILLVFIIIASPFVVGKWHWGKCEPDEFECKDGTCVPGNPNCNGTAECPDKSDEIFSLCWKYQCNVDMFRCAYGGCVDGFALCDGKQDCADNSDELIHFCNNDIDTVVCSERTNEQFEIDERALDSNIYCVNSKDYCDTGKAFWKPVPCNGRVDCEDGSDESLATCADAVCNPPLFRCAYGGCTHRRAACNGVKDCADGSDEWDDVCGRTPSTETTISTTANPKNTCVLPPFPEHGTYSVGGLSKVEVGKELGTFMLTYSCDPPYVLIGSRNILCFKGLWTREKPRCIGFCRLPKHDSVEYICQNSDEFLSKGKECEELVAPGTVVTPHCRQPVYTYPGTIFDMHCQDGKWDHIVHCTPVCGRLGKQLRDEDPKPNELPWHAIIYIKKTRAHRCGGTIVRNNVVISAAHCFNSQPPRKFLVAAGKLFKTWNHPLDIDPQFSEISEIHIPERYRGSATNYQNDLAVLVLASNLRYTMNIRPICLDFKPEFDSQQLKPYSVGLIAGWGKVRIGKEYVSVVRAALVPYIYIGDCIAETPPEKESYLTSDKFCAGYQISPIISERAAGNGLTFPALRNGLNYYYLRGIASTIVVNDIDGYDKSITSFTHVLTHQLFIEQFLTTNSTKLTN